MKVTIELPDALQSETAALVADFAQAMGDKLRAAEIKYGYSDFWIDDDWMDACRAKLREHLEKGDPRDVANYCAFLWYHKQSTAQTESAAPKIEGTQEQAGTQSSPPSQDVKSSGRLASDAAAPLVQENTEKQKRAEAELILQAFQQAVLETNGTLWTSIQLRAAVIIEEARSSAAAQDALIGKQHGRNSADEPASAADLPEAATEAECAGGTCMHGMDPNGGEHMVQCEKHAPEREPVAWLIRYGVDRKVICSESAATDELNRLSRDGFITSMIPLYSAPSGEREDTVRLDWMEANPGEAYRAIEDAGYKCENWESPGFRAAIDDARGGKHD